MTKIVAVTFDFDGVIVADSEYIKERSWDAVITRLGEASRLPLEKARERWSKGRGSRFDILRDTLRALDYSPEVIPVEVEHCAAVYNKSVQDAIFAKGVRPVDLQGIERLQARGKLLYINSATPETAMQETVVSLGIKKFFRGVFGQPTKKVENLQRVLAAERITPEAMVFLGDGDGDYDASQAVQCRFVGLANSWNRWRERLPAPPFKLVDSINEFADWCEEQ